MNQLVIVGSGGQGRIVLDVLRAQWPNADVVFVDDDPKTWGTEVEGARVVHGMQELLDGDPPDEGVVVAIGNPIKRREVAARLAASGVTFANAVDPRAVVAASAKLGHGNMVSPGAIVDTGTTIGDHCIINPGVVIAHDCRIGDTVLLGPGAHLGARVTIEDGAFVALGASVTGRCTVGAGSVVAAGSTVLEDIPPHQLAMGTPARVTREIGDDYDWSKLL